MLVRISCEKYTIVHMFQWPNNTSHTEIHALDTLHKYRNNTIICTYLVLGEGDHHFLDNAAHQVRVAIRLLQLNNE